MAMIGPRARRKQETFLEEARKQKEQEMEQQHAFNLRNEIVYESTAIAAQQEAKSQMLENNSCNLYAYEPNSEVEDEDGIISVWSQQVKGAKKVKGFARCTSFSNDIHDGRLNHSEAT